MAVTEADVEQCLRGVTDPNTGRDFVVAKSVKKIRVDGDSVNVDVQLGYPAKSQHEALKRLELLDERQARVVELRFFGGMTVEESATILGVSPRTVDLDWRMAKAWLIGQLGL